jgi:eukaryotic-like serine/threonine-protein kinase
VRYKPGDKVDDYLITEELGEGAYAEAYKAIDQTNGSTVMIKSPNPMMVADPQIFQRFAREAEIARRIDHPGVQRSLALRQPDGQAYLVLEYIDGELLRRHLQKFKGDIPIALAIDWGRQLAETLQYLHSQGVVHRDLKPENILITAEGRLKILDFGSALLTGARRLTWRHLSEGVGTPDYMSPEQIQGARGDERSDIYAWGIMMYEFLTGRIPFEGDNWLAVMAGHLQRAPRPIRELRSEVSPALDAVVLTAMRRMPENRYQTAAELLVDLNRVDSLDLSKFDLSPEAPIGGMAAPKSGRDLWIYVGLIAGGFLALVILVIVIALLFK